MKHTDLEDGEWFQLVGDPAKELFRHLRFENGYAVVEDTSGVIGRMTGESEVAIMEPPSP
jgi:hypothetical protein